MTSEPRDRLSDIFHAALARAPAERDAFLQEVCKDDDLLRQEVESLLRDQGAPEGFLDTPAAAAIQAGATPAPRSSSVNRQLGPYVLLAPLGAGGMGEVYRARDTRLQRDVAVKILPPLLTTDPERRTRFAREARLLATLNHPNIGAIYGLEEADGDTALVLELVEGPTLAQRLECGPLPVPQAFAIAYQIADALDAAHEKGIIHRDLKPANILLQTVSGSDDVRAKVLDFGVAKLMTPPGADEPGSGTVTATGTEVGLILGTPAYMSPEQARGLPVDKRTDIWAFGCVLFEMLTGQRPFAGATVTETLAAILREAPDWTAVPPRARRLVRQCLEKNPARRLRDIADAMTLIDDEPPAQARTARRRAWPWLLLPIAALVAIAGMRILQQPEPSIPEQLRFQIPLPHAAAGAPILSPDGRTIAIMLAGARVWLYSLETGESRYVLEATKAPGPLFWSPDSRFLAFFADGRLNRMNVATGQVSTICDAPALTGTGAWNHEDTIVFGWTRLMRVAASGGTPVPLTELDPARHEIGHLASAFLPDGRHFLYSRVSSNEEISGIYVGSIDASPEAQSTRMLMRTRVTPIYRPLARARHHYLLFGHGRQLVAQRFDPATLELAGEAVPIAEPIAYASVPNFDRPLASVSATGILAYRRQQTVSAMLVWVNRDGQEVGPAVEGVLADAENPRLSPDGQRLAVMLAGDLWVYDLTGKPPVRLTSDGGPRDLPLWSPDGQRLVYASNRSPQGLRSVSSHIAGDAPQLFSPPGHYHPHGWSADGRAMIAVVNTYSPTTWDIETLLVDQPTAPPQPILKTTAAEGLIGASLSPDGGWLAYTSNVTGSQEVWVQPYRGPGVPQRISPNGGADPVWARNGRELYYLEGNRMMAVSVATAPAFDFSRPLLLFTSSYLHPALSPLSYDVAEDGRFLMLKQVEQGSAAPSLDVVANWFARLP